MKFSKYLVIWIFVPKRLIITIPSVFCYSSMNVSVGIRHHWLSKSSWMMEPSVTHKRKCLFELEDWLATLASWARNSTNERGNWHCWIVLELNPYELKKSLEKFCLSLKWFRLNTLPLWKQRFLHNRLFLQLSVRSVRTWREWRHGRGSLKIIRN